MLLINEALFVGAMFLYQFYKRLWQIKHAPFSYFGNADNIFIGDLYQAQLLKDSWFLNLMFYKKKNCHIGFG